MMGCRTALLGRNWGAQAVLLQCELVQPEHVRAGHTALQEASGCNSNKSTIESTIEGRSPARECWGTRQHVDLDLACAAGHPPLQRTDP